MFSSSGEMVGYMALAVFRGKWNVLPDLQGSKPKKSIYHCEGCKNFKTSTMSSHAGNKDHHQAILKLQLKKPFNVPQSM